MTQDGIGKSFMRLLVEDALSARERRMANDTALHRREEIRATFAAIEGITWIYREDVRHTARMMGVLTPFADLALRERTFAVTDKGDIVEQVRFVTLPTIIRLTTKQARLVAPSIHLDLTQPGWSQLRRSIEVRNRVTHPKTSADFAIDDADLSAAEAGLLWLMKLVDHAAMAIHAAQREYNDIARNVIADLVAGDEQTWQDYRDVSSSEDDG